MFYNPQFAQLQQLLQMMTQQRQTSPLRVGAIKPYTVNNATAQQAQPVAQPQTQPGPVYKSPGQYISESLSGMNPTPWGNRVGGK